ncbi:hypothetical protein M409DRAFT_67054 [Zasmidium cellare ATCC 36951]|uniref:Enoyl-CoA hydratase n=1 Tax=Zasmidium cellare ATCC 36951 TaxID=1080233 RepID=A0A6A6CJ10_ZASCE|nr:uncharacterized protein M409DRAFT_67054 [Zasmidium cellare ATCC 36951]KAF2165679.1 hypothetical protein M409DRAFT_67054 [Zasmidium cellare ATCC 36951]
MVGERRLISSINNDTNTLIQHHVPESYSTLSLENLKVTTYPENASSVTPVIVVTLDRPRQRNAFTLRAMEDLESLFPKFDVDERVKCVVLTGAGDTFCAGIDLQRGFDAMGRTEKLLDNRDPGGRINLAISRCRKPTIVAMNGSAAGIGMTMTLAADIRIAHASSKYVFPFSQLGITMESNWSFFLPRLIGYSNAIYLLTTSEPQRGDSKFFSSLFHEVYDERERVLSRALEIAILMAEKTSGLASPPTPEETHILESAIGFSISGSSDVKEGVDSFFEKRIPKFEATLEKDGPPIYPWYREVDFGLTRPKKASSKL